MCKLPDIALYEKIVKIHIIFQFSGVKFVVIWGGGGSKLLLLSYFNVLAGRGRSQGDSPIFK